MLAMLDGTDPIKLGREAHKEPGIGVRHNYRRLADRAITGSDSVLLADFGYGRNGHLVTLPADEAATYGLSPEPTPVAYWYGGDTTDETPTLRILSIEDAHRLRNESVSVAVDRIVQHYRTTPGDDGHPAHALAELVIRLKENQRAYSATE